MNKTKQQCEARQYSDMMHCKKCGLAWDMNDPDEPACGSTTVEYEIKQALKATIVTAAIVGAAAIALIAYVVHAQP